MILPLHDDNPLKIIPYQRVTVSLIALNILIFVLQAGGSIEAYQASVEYWGLRPASFFDGIAAAEQNSAGWQSWFSYMFLHGGWGHLLGNMLCLWVFGDNIEDSMGHKQFLVFYLLCGLAAAACHYLVDPRSPVPMIGASGAIAGVMGAYLILHPRVKMWVLVFGRIPLKLPAMIPLLLWFVIQFLNLGQGDVAWWAHIGGFVSGALLITIMRDPNIPLFDRGIKH